MNMTSLNSSSYNKNVANTTIGGGKYHDRVNKIQEKIHGLHQNIESEKSNKLEGLDRKINDVDNKVVEWHETNTKKFNLVKQEINDIQKYIEEDK